MTVDFPIDDIRADFPILERNVRNKPLVYFDNAATTLKPKQVVKALHAHYLMGASNVHRGVHYLSEVATDQVDKARLSVQKFLNARYDSEIVFTPGTTAGINTIAQGYCERHLKPGDEVLITHMEHHSNIVPWQMLAEKTGIELKVAPIDDDGDVILEKFASLISPKTKVVSFVYVSNSLGTVNPVKQMIELAKEKGAVTIIDGAQAVAHLPIDVQDLDCDYFCFSGHKLFGPTGIGVMYGKREMLSKMNPMLGGGGMIRSVAFDKTTFADAPSKFEAGTPHIGGIIGLGAAIDFVENIGRDNIAAYEEDLFSFFTKAVTGVKGFRPIGTATHKTSVISFLIDDIHPHDIGTLLDMEGVAIRAGHHCTQPVMQRFGVPATARASISFYNTKSEVVHFIEALEKARETFQ